MRDMNKLVNRVLRATKGMSWDKANRIVCRWAAWASKQK